MTTVFTFQHVIHVFSVRSHITVPTTHHQGDQDSESPVHSRTMQILTLLFCSSIRTLGNNFKCTIKMSKPQLRLLKNDSFFMFSISAVILITNRNHCAPQVNFINVCISLNGFESNRFLTVKDSLDGFESNRFLTISQKNQSQPASFISLFRDFERTMSA